MEECQAKKRKDCMEDCHAEKAREKIAEKKAEGNLKKLEQLVDQLKEGKEWKGLVNI